MAPSTASYANEAGGKNSLDCTLIVTEGDSAKTLAVSGLGVIGRDYYGVFPLRGRLLNVREASNSQVSCREWAFVLYVCCCAGVSGGCLHAFLS